MRFCYNCGKQVDDNVLLCPECGALVKRYTDDMDERDIPPTPEEQAQQETFKGRIYVDAAGKTRIRGLLKAWFIITAVGCSLIAFSYLSTLLVYWKRDLFAQIFAIMPSQEYAVVGGYDVFMAMWNEAMAMLAKLLGYYIALTVLAFLKAGSDVWLLISKQKKAFIARQALILIIALLLMLIQNLGFAIVFATDGFITSMLLGKDKFLLK